MLEKFKENLRVERWKDTPFREILAIDWQAAPEVESSAPINALLPEESVIIPIVNGVIANRWIDDKQLPDGLLLHAEGRKVAITLVKESLIERPIVFYLEHNAKEPLHFSPEITVKAEAGSRASFMMIEAGEGQYLTTPKVRVDVEKSAHIEWIRTSINSDSAYSVVDFKANQAEESHFHLVSYQSRTKLSRLYARMEVNGEEAFTKLDGLNIGIERQHLAHVIDMAHMVPNCSSEQQIKNIIKDRAVALFDGEIYVNKDAQKIDADQMTRSLILDDGARTLTIPRLEIYADDVQCTHGATVGFIEKSHLFYLQSRGLSEESARKLLMRAYGAEIIESITHQSLQEWLLHVLDEDIERLL